MRVLAAGDKLKPGTWLKIRNGRVDMFKATMRLCVDRDGSLEVTSEGPGGDAETVKARFVVL